MGRWIFLILIVFRWLALADNVARAVGRKHCAVRGMIDRLKLHGQKHKTRDTAKTKSISKPKFKNTTARRLGLGGCRSFPERRGASRPGGNSIALGIAIAAACRLGPGPL